MYRIKNELHIFDANLISMCFTRFLCCGRSEGYGIQVLNCMCRIIAELDMFNFSILACLLLFMFYIYKSSSKQIWLPFSFWFQNKVYSIVNIDNLYLLNCA